MVQEVGDLANHLKFEDKYIALVGKEENRKEIMKMFDILCPGIDFMPDISLYSEFDKEVVNRSFVEYINMPKLSSRIKEFGDLESFRE